MNATPNLERDLAGWMAAVVPSAAPDQLAPEIVARTGSIRPRPGWLARLLEPPMQTHLSFGRTLAFGRSARPVLVALIVLALLVAAFYVGSQIVRQQTLPPPFGVAQNGVIATEIDESIVVMNADGSGMRTLKLPFEGLTEPVFSRDGTRFAAWATPDPAHPADRWIIVANADGSGAAQVGAEYRLGPVSQLAWSPDDKVLAFSDVGDRIYLVDLASGSATEFAPDARFTRRRDPAWAPDGRLAYRCQEDLPDIHLCVTSADRTNERILETTPGTSWSFQHSAWSHDGTRLAYYVDDLVDYPGPGQGFDLATIDLVTDEERVLTVGHPEHFILPTWSPDDRYVVTLPGIVAADGSSVRLMGEPDGCSWAEPSPDGKWAACQNTGWLKLYPMAGGEPTVIQLAAGTTGFLSWQRLAEAK